MVKLFENTTKEKETDALASYLPGGVLFQGARDPDKNLRKLLVGLACELFRVEQMMNLISEDHDILLTQNFIDQWESAVGIPDDCFAGTGTLEERRQHILLKFARMNAQTEQDYIDIAEALGFTDIEVVPLQEIAFPVYPVPFFPTKAPESRFIVLITGEEIVPGVPPYDVPFTPNGGSQAIIQCIFDKISPANVRVIYLNKI